MGFFVHLSQHGNRRNNGLVVVKVFVVENMGAHHIVDVKYGEEVIRVRTAPTVKPKTGETLLITFDMERIRLFDKRTEQSIMI